MKKELLPLTQVDPRVMRAARAARVPGTHLEVINPTTVMVVNDGASVPKGGITHPKKGKA